MRVLTQWIVASIFFIISTSAFASSCFLGGYGSCIWGFDARNSENNRLIDPALFLTFCAEHRLHCSSNNAGYNSLIGRPLDEEIFIIAGAGFGGPDLIFSDKRQAEEFIHRFTGAFPNLLFYAKNFNWLARRAVAVGYQENTADNIDQIKLLFLPNEWGSTGDNCTYSPPDM